MGLSGLAEEGKESDSVLHPWRVDSVVYLACEITPLDSP